MEIKITSWVLGDTNEMQPKMLKQITVEDILN
jgi:hypothetical protein